MEFDATFIIAIISFIVFLRKMDDHFFYPIYCAMSARDTRVAKIYESAETIQKLSDKLLKETQEGLKKSRDEAQAVIAEKTKEFKLQRTQAIAEYREEFFGNIAKEKEELRNSAIDAKELLKDNIVDLAKGISYKLLGDNIDASHIDKSQIREGN